MNRKSFIRLALVTAILLPTTGCVQNPFVAGNNFFSYKIDVKKKLTIDYGFTNNDYVVLFELYDQYPLETIKDADNNDLIVKKKIEPIYRGATDASGKFKGDIMVLSAMTSVWLYTEYAGGISPVEIKIQGSSIDFNLNKYLTDNRTRGLTSRAATSSSKVYPDGWFVLGDWDLYGTPDYLDAERILPPASLLYNINDIYVKYNKQNLNERFPDFFQEQYKSEIDIIKPTKVYLSFINSTAAWSNAVGYFTYPTGQEPQTPGEIQRILAFPSCNPFLKTIDKESFRGALVAGDRVLLKYWDGNQFHDEFPEGVSIGWWMEGLSFDTKNGNVRLTNYSRFSLDHLNNDNRRRTVALQDPRNGRVVAIGFEDNSDMRYNDATFYLEVEEEGSIDSNLPEVPDAGGMPDDSHNYVFKEGYLLFEDLWPSKGDYDMNDVVIKYSSKVYKYVISNRVYKIVDEYLPLHSGGSLISGFGYQLSDIALDQVHKVTIEAEETSVYMEGEMLEPGQDKATIILFDNIKKAIGKTYTVTTEFNDAIENSVLPPYNPFIIVKADKKRNHEVHLVGYAPTSKMDQTLLGTLNDGSDPSKKIFYVDKEAGLYPFSLNIPTSSLINNFASWEAITIDKTFPKFKGWVESKGNNNRDWYKFPATE